MSKHSPKSMKRYINANINPKIIIYIMVIITPICMMAAYYWARAEGHLIRPFTNGRISCSPEEIALYSYIYSAFIGGCASVSATMRYLPESFILHAMFSLDAVLIAITFFFFKPWLLELNKYSDNPFKKINLHASIIMWAGVLGGLFFLISTSMWNGRHVYDIYLGPVNVGDWHAILAYTFCSLILLSSLYFTIVEYKLRKSTPFSKGYKICFSIRILSFVTFIAIFSVVIGTLIINKKLKILNAGLEYWMIHIFILWYISFIFDKKFFNKFNN
jgi:hypothetical protein